MATMQALDPALDPPRIVAELGAEERALLVACAELYRGRWEDLAEDCRRRQAGEPYLFRLAGDPAWVLAWAERFRTYEVVRGARLSDALPPGGDA